jgi:hypothetical protein
MSQLGHKDASLTMKLYAHSQEQWPEQSNGLK